MPTENQCLCGCAVAMWSMTGLIRVPREENEPIHPPSWSTGDETKTR